MFQSAPLTEARGDPLSKSWTPHRRCFNPLPSPKQGETHGFEPIDVDLRVSIRSPHRSKGRLGTLRRPARAHQFQSAPLTEARGDPLGVAHAYVARKQSFNPLPSPKQGETPDTSAVGPVDTKFQSAPLTEARGDRPAPTRYIDLIGFNPLPSPKQGETAKRKGNLFFGLVSIRSPHRSKGRLLSGACKHYTRIVSIRSPHRSKGRHPKMFGPEKQGETSKNRGRAFNPLPSPKQGETKSCLSLLPKQKVSIRSPHRSKGRRDCFSHLIQHLAVSIRSPHRSKGRHSNMFYRDPIYLFQSAPLTEARGDCAWSSTPSRKPWFQSAPLTEARGDDHRPLLASQNLCFNPLPSPKQGETGP